MKIIIHLGRQEEAALKSLARVEVRDPRAQAYLILRDELARRGLLVAKPQTAPVALPAEDPKHEAANVTG